MRPAALPILVLVVALGPAAVGARCQFHEDMDPRTSCCGSPAQCPSTCTTRGTSIMNGDTMLRATELPTKILV